MKKEEIRKEFFKLKEKGPSYEQCRKILKVTYNYHVTTRTLQRWSRRFKENEWNLRDYSRKPKKIHRKITPKTEGKIISIRKKTGWGEYKIKKLFPDISHTTINRILRKHNLIKKSKRKKLMRQYPKKGHISVEKQKLYK